MVMVVVVVVRAPVVVTRVVGVGVGRPRVLRSRSTQRSGRRRLLHSSSSLGSLLRVGEVEADRRAERVREMVLVLSPHHEREVAGGGLRGHGGGELDCQRRGQRARVRQEQRLRLRRVAALVGALEEVDAALRDLGRAEQLVELVASGARDDALVRGAAQTHEQRLSGHEVARVSAERDARDGEVSVLDLPVVTIVGERRHGGRSNQSGKESDLH
mmetsp:Transcript_27750/g.89333  ORF Transcript_27750/g.89333 Transcript_27750/m.89333 type:complete len:215 (+) Transcript_27750:787-1431(+)